MQELAPLLSPIRIRHLELANRCVLPAMGTNLGHRDGTVSDANLAYLKRRAESGMGLIITELLGVHPTGTIGLGIYDDRFLSGLKALAETVHQAGPKVAAQLHHAGREAYPQLKKGTALAPSAVRSLVYGLTPQEMSPEDIRSIIDAFGQAARRAREAGFDAVEIHGAHGYLLTQFLSALSNRRTDAYGGDIRSRARFVIEVIAEVRRQVGADFPVLLRLSVEEVIKNGYTADEIGLILPDLVTAGADVIHASVGTHGSPGGITSAPVEFAEGWNAERAASIKAIVDIPVIAVGRFSDPRTAAAVIARGDADMVAFGRQALADPDFLHKAIAGQFERIRRCLACNQGCIERLMLEPGASIRCAINPETGRELVYPRQPGTKPQKVWVIGAGPAGLTAAGESARLGHQVTLFEKEAAAGGQIRFAAQAPYKTPYQNWIDWLTRETERLGVDIKLATPVTNILIEGSDADHVILANGGEGIEPSIPGIERDHVFQAMQILQGELKPGRDVVVIGGGLIGMETADYLSVSGSRVTLIEMQLHSPVLKITGHGYQLHKRLRETGCRILLNTTVEAILEDAVVTVSGDRQETIRPVDQVVIAVGMKPNAELKPALEEKGIPCTTVGDAVQVRRIIEATGEGAEAAWRLSVNGKH